MKCIHWGLMAAGLAFMFLGHAAAQQPAQKPAAAGPVLLVETAKGAFQIETYPADAPKTVEHIVALAKRNFYNGQRVHRVVGGFVVQFGDPQIA